MDEEDTSLVTEIPNPTDENEEKEKKPLFHPFKCRLNDEAAIETSSPTDLTQVGFACWSIGMLTIFRPCFVLLLSILTRVNVTTSTFLVEKFALAVSYFWFVVLMFVFFALGFIPTFATSIKKRCVLLIHPWALLLLYFDFIVWLTITILLQIELYKASPFGEHTVKQVKHTGVFFAIIYIDILVYFVIYYVYGTYYIVAELTIIEKFY